VIDGVEFKVEGLEQLHDRMKTLTVGMRKKGVRAGVRKGTNIVRDAARAAAQAIDRPETPLSIAKNVDAQFNGRLYRRTGDVSFRVGVRGGAKSYSNTKENRRKRRVGESYKTGGTTFYWRFIELGTSRIPARPFLLPALENNAGKALEAMVTEMNKQLDRFAKKGAV
jgi:HK97 gp10 family phage protein